MGVWCGGKCHQHSYLRSPTGILKFSCLLYQLAAIFTICLSSVSISNVRGKLYISVAVASLLCTGVVLVLRIFALCQRTELIYKLNLSRYEAFLAFGLSLATFGAAGFALTLDVPTYNIVAFFGFLSSCCYIWDGCVNYGHSVRCDAATQTDQHV